MLELALLMLAVVASIGPTNLFAIKEGIRHGASNTFYVIFGGVLVDLFYANLAGLGLTALGENIYFKTVLLGVGAMVFIYLGVKGLKVAFQKKMIEAAKVKSRAHPLLIGIMMTLPNPFTIIFWITAIASLSIGYKPLVFFVGILVIGAMWAAVEAGVIHFSRRFITNRVIRVVEAGASLIILGFGVKFVVQFAGLVA